MMTLRNDNLYATPATVNVPSGHFRHTISQFGFNAELRKANAGLKATTTGSIFLCS